MSGKPRLFGENPKPRGPRRTAGQLLPDSLSEADWQSAVIEYSHLRGWAVVVHRKSATGRTCWRADGTTYQRWETAWGTPESAGTFDLLLFRERMVAVELKAHGGRVTKEEGVWAERYQKAGIACYVWEPRDRAEMERTLT